MCPAHRKKAFSSIRTDLEADKPCRVVSTQLVEAGVDIDFPVVYRALAGIDSIAQAAGRCNREGRLLAGHVYVFESESGLPPGHFRQTAQAAKAVARHHGEDLLSLAAIEEYFKLYYWTKGDALDKKRIIGKLQDSCGSGDFPFATIARDFTLLDTSTQPIVIPYDDKAKYLIDSMDVSDSPASLSRRVQKYTVAVYPNQFDQLVSSGQVSIRADLFPVLDDESLYDSDMGLLVGNDEFGKPKTLIV
jgi:hypothetical protein